MTPQAMRSPEFPDGSVFMSSPFAWMTSAVPPPVKSDVLPGPKLTRGSVTVTFAVPSDFTVKFFMSPA